MGFGILGMCASYDPDPDAYLGLHLPLDMETAELIPERWANFAKWDPVNMVEIHGPKLKALRALQRIGVPHRYEEFPDNHSNIDYRMDISLPFLAAALG
ncbi:MAG: hypothetical protein KGL25_09755 [Gammaproteobacteria bacterium]|nr:hypothetical protein [Gammaproteobacteria bacterium]